VPALAARSSNPCRKREKKEPFLRENPSKKERGTTGETPEGKQSRKSLVRVGGGKLLDRRAQVSISTAGKEPHYRRGKIAKNSHKGVSEKKRTPEKKKKKTLGPRKSNLSALKMSPQRMRESYSQKRALGRGGEEIKL